MPVREYVVKRSPDAFFSFLVLLGAGGAVAACEASSEAAGADAARPNPDAADRPPDGAPPTPDAASADAALSDLSTPPRDARAFDSALTDSALTDSAVLPPDAHGADAAGPDAAQGSDTLPLGDCDPSRGLGCEGALVCTPADLAELSACPVAPAVFDTPGCGPMPHPDGAGTITPTCCSAADCAAGGPSGRCIYTERQTGCCGTQGETHCVYDACAQDADCAADQICLTTGMRGVEANTCVAAACRSDADCAAVAGAECRLLGIGTFAALTCAALDAPCRADAACRGECPTALCEPIWAVEGGEWRLQTGTACDITSCQAVP